MNFFRRLRKLVATERLEAKVTKHYDEPRTPYQRLLAFGILDEATQQSLDMVLARLNPAELQRRIERLLHQLWDCTDHAKGANLASVG